MQTDEPLAPTPSFPSSAILPDHPAYDEHRRSFNGALDRRPAVIVPCTTTGEVVAAVRAARAAALPIAVRGGAHSVAGHGFADGALVVSLAAMREIRVDPDARIAHAGGGAQWNDIDAAAFAHGLAVPGGTFGDTGIGGLTLGGGIGWLMPVAGLTCDNLIEAEVVTADGSVVIAGPDHDRELLWALRGGGGNFGVVTRFTYRLTPVGPMVGGSLTYRADAASAVLARVEELIERHPTATMPTLTIQRDPEMGPIVGFAIGIVDGSDPEPILDLLRRDLPVVADDIGPRTYLELQAQNGILPFGLRHYWKGHFLRALDAPTFESLVEACLAPDAIGEAFILIEGMTGVARTEPAGGAAFGQRAARWNASAIAIWESPEDDAVAIGWARRVAALLEPLSFSGGGYVNYSPVDESAERVMAAYGSERWERLVAVKRRYDPDNVFRFNHNIRPD
jgi:FAD/FMN-containing dehydrogenase